MKQFLAQKRRSMPACIRYVLSAVLMCGVAATSLAQTNLPALQGYDKPSPEPTAPGDSFTPTMSGTPAANTPEMAEWTRTAGPDESLTITGFNFSRFTGTDEGKDSRFLVYGRNGATKQARIQRVDASKALITLPKDMPAWSMYLIWPGNGAGYGKPIAINKTDAWWVGPDKATRGATVSVFGRNLAQNNDTLRSHVYIKSVGGSGQWATVTDVNPYKVDFTIPTGLANGEYEIWTHNGHGGQYGWSGPLTLNIDDAPEWNNTVFNVKNYGATGNGYTDDIAAITKALYAARNTPGATIYFPAGTYMVSNFLQAFNYVKWKGDGKDRTTIKCTPNFYSSWGLVFGTVYNFSVNDMTFDTNNSFRGGKDKPVLLRGGKDIWFNNVKFNFKGFNIADFHESYRVFLNNCDHIGITSFLGNCSQLFIDRNNFVMTNDSEMALHTWGGVGISMTRSTCRDLNNSDPSNGAGWGKGRFFVGNGTWGSNRYTYLGNNRTTDLTPRPSGEVDQNSGEQFLWEGNLGQWAGRPSSSTATTTTLSGFSTNSPNSYYAVIIKGKGLGQSRRVTSNSGGTITLNEPWNVIPDASSYIIVGHFIDRIAIYNNYFDGKDRASTDPNHIAAAAVEPFGGAFNVIADNNTMHQLRQGIANWSTQHTTGLDPNYFNLYVNNKMRNVRWGIYNEIGRVYRPEGIAMLGVTYRNNTVDGAVISAVFNSVKTADPILEGNIYEHNTFNNVPYGVNGSTMGVANQLLYNNHFSGSGTAITISPKLILRENTYQGFSKIYDGDLPRTVEAVIEAPLHVIDLEGSAGGSVVKTDFTLMNSGVASMNWIATSSAPWLTLSTNSGSIADERGISLIELNANPATLPAGNHSAIITITSGELVQKYTVQFKLTTPENGVSITSPVANTLFSAAESITITANATDTQSGVAKVEFFSGNTKLGEDTSSPYSFTWNNAPAGTHSLTAKAISNTGSTTSSAAVTVTKTNNAEPTVAITSPIATTVYSAPASITINANAADTDGNVTKVEFYNGTTLLGTATNSPYSFTWYNAPTGSYYITVKATDNTGTTTTSAPVKATVVTATGPSVVLTSPGLNASINAPTNAYISANADFSDGYITRVEFFNNGNKIGEKIAPPYDMYWMNIATGTYNITARATASNGVTSTTAPFSLIVNKFATPINAVPTVAITAPTATNSFTAPSGINITANASDKDGSISKIEFFYGTTKLGEDATAPYTFSWANVQAGSYSLTVRATDNDGASTTSDPVNITVKQQSINGNAAPAVALTSPTATNFTAPASITLTANAADTDGSISKVEFYQGNTLLGTDNTSPYSFTWNNAAAGAYTLTAKATDNAGLAATSASIGISVITQTSPDTPIAPTVALTSPANATSFTAPANFTITASATDSDGSVSKVEFFNGSVKLGEDTSAPYSFSWSNVAAGSYAITAKATDNSGLTTISAAVNVTVNAATAPVACAGTGSISYDYWLNVPWSNGTLSVPFSSTPSGGGQLNSFATPVNTANFYGVRVRGYICPPTTGNYVFYLAADDLGELWLSTTDNPADKQKIASVSSWTNSEDYNKFPSQQSQTIYLKAGQRYYIEAIMQEGYGWDHLSVGWQLPGGTLQRPIAGEHLMPFNGQTTAPTVALTSPANATSFTAPANFIIDANANDADGSVSKVEFFNGSVKLGEDTNAPYSFSWSNVAAGSYTITAKATDNSGLTTTSAAINVTVNAATAPVACSGTGGISYEYWENVPWNNGTMSVPFSSTPTRTGQLTSFATPVHIDNYYGVRLRGYICPPTTGNYVFYLAADDLGELLLSTTDNPVDKQKIAFVNSWTYPSDFEKFPSQQSQTIYLKAGQRYYIEAIMQEGYGWDHLSVGWQLPGGTLQKAIAGEHLMPFVQTALRTSKAPVTEEIFQNTANKALTAYPNPFSFNTTIAFTLTQDEEYTLSVYDMKGSLVKTLRSGKGKANELISVNWEAENVSKGLYNVRLSTKSSVQHVKIVLN